MMMLEVVVGSLGSTSMASEDLVLTDILGMNLKGVYFFCQTLMLKNIFFLNCTDNSVNIKLRRRKKT